MYTVLLVEVFAFMTLDQLIIAPNKCRVVALIFLVFYSELKLLW